MLGWLLKAGAYTSLLRVVAMVVTLGFVALMSHWMPAADFGLLAMLISGCTFAAAFGAFGQSQLIIRDGAPAHGSGDIDAAKRIFSAALGRVLLVSVPLGCLVGISFGAYAQNWIYGLSATCVMIGLSFLLALSAISRSIGQYLWALGPKDIFWRGGILAMTAVALWFGITPEISLVVMIASGMMILLVALQMWNLRLHPDVRMIADLGYWRISAAFMITNVGGIALSNVDVLFVGVFFSELAVAQYFPANRLALLAGFFGLPFQMVVAPKLAKLIKQDDWDATQRLQSMFTLFVTAGAIGVALILLASYQVYIPLFATAGADTYSVLLVLLGGQVAMAALGSPGTLLNFTGHQNLVAKTAILLLVSLLGTLLLLGMMGADLIYIAVATAIIPILQKGAFVVIAKQKLGVWPITVSSLRRPKT